MDKLTKTEKVGVHLALLSIVVVCENHNKKGKRWFNRALTILYRTVIGAEILCVVNDLRGGKNAHPNR